MDSTFSSFSGRPHASLFYFYDEEPLHTIFNIKMKRPNDFFSIGEKELTVRKIQKIDYSDDPLKEFEVEEKEKVC